MTPTRRNFAVLLVVTGAAALVAIAPIAAADPGTPEAGSEAADATISDLKAQGYNVKVNYVSGTPDVPLSECSVTQIDTAAAPSASVWVECDEAGD